MVKFTENKDLALLSDNWVVSFYGDKEKQGFRRKVGKLMLAKDCVTDAKQWKKVLQIAESYFMSECNRPKVVVEYMLNGFQMEMKHKNSIYGCRNQKTYKFVNPILN